MNKIVKQIIKGTLIASLIASQSYASSQGVVGGRPVVQVGRAFVEADPSVRLVDLAKSIDLNELRKELGGNQIRPAHLKEAYKIIAHFKSQGRDLETITKQDLLSLYPNLQEQNLGSILLALIPLAIAFIGIAMQRGNERYEQRKEYSDYQAQQYARIQNAQAQIAEAQARAAQAEAAAAEARAAQLKAEAQNTSSQQ